MTNNFAVFLEKIKELVKIFPFSPKQQTEALGKYQITISLRVLSLIKDRLTKEEQDRYFNVPPTDINQWYKELQQVIDSRLDEKLSREISEAIRDETKIFVQTLLKNCPQLFKEKLETFAKENNLV